ncbi:MAG: hypothetical protein FRX49_11265 [Trebouxia sp. A1-2]|nr:MAG: hypothetical protein FRX49_11265 [Trebouxia sp. A1-2]
MTGHVRHHEHQQHTPLNNHGGSVAQQLGCCRPAHASIHDQQYNDHNECETNREDVCSPLPNTVADPAKEAGRDKSRSGHLRHVQDGCHFCIDDVQLVAVIQNDYILALHAVPQDKGINEPSLHGTTFWLSLSHQTSVSPNDEPPIVITVPHDGSYDQPHSQQHNAEHNAANGPNEIGIAVYNDKNAVSAPPVAEASLKLLCWLCDCKTLWLGFLHEKQGNGSPRRGKEVGCARGGTVVYGEDPGFWKLGELGVGKRYRPMVDMRRSSMRGWLHDCMHCFRVKQSIAYPSK